MFNIKVALHNFYQKNPHFIVCFSICMLALIICLINGRFGLADFEVYYTAADRLWHNKSMYRIVEDGHYVFKYSPFFAVLFTPFLLFNFYIAKILYWICLSFLVYLNISWSIKILPKSLLNKSTYSAVFFFAFFVTSKHWYRELHLGQVNIILLSLYLVSFYFLQNNKQILSSFFLAISVFFKPYCLIFIPYYFIKGKIKEILLFVFFVFVLSLIPILFFDSFADLSKNYYAWLNELAIQLKLKTNLASDSNITIYSLLYKYLNLKYLIPSVIKAQTFQFYVLSLIAIFTFVFIKTTAKNSLSTKYFDYVFLTSLIPIVSATDSNAFYFLLPTIVLIYSSFNKFSLASKSFVVASSLLYGGSIYEIVGRNLHNLFHKWCFVTLGSLIFVYVLWLQKRKMIAREKKKRFS
jgi:hypothetical protein